MRSWPDTTVSDGHQKCQYLHRPREDRMNCDFLGQRIGIGVLRSITAYRAPLVGIRLPTRFESHDDAMLESFLSP
jgi:hypothetical protein